MVTMETTNMVLISITKVLKVRLKVLKNYFTKKARYKRPYLRFDGKIDIDDAIKLTESLMYRYYLINCYLPSY